MKFINCAWVKCKYVFGSIAKRLSWVQGPLCPHWWSVEFSFYIDLAGDYRNYNPRAVLVCQQLNIRIIGCILLDELKALCIADCRQLINTRVPDLQSVVHAKDCELSARWKCIKVKWTLDKMLLQIAVIANRYAGCWNRYRYRSECICISLATAVVCIYIRACVVCTARCIANWEQW